jgi:hypothetical protein
MVMALQLSAEQAEALRRRADKEGCRMEQVALAALEEYLSRAEQDDLADHRAQRYALLEPFDVA